MSFTWIHLLSFVIFVIFFLHVCVIVLLNKFIYLKIITVHCP